MMTGSGRYRYLRIVGRVCMVVAGLALALLVATSAVFADTPEMRAQDAYSAVTTRD